MTASMEIVDRSESPTDRFLRLAIVAGICGIVMEVAYLLRQPLPFEISGMIVGHDFVNTWIGAQLAIAGDPSPFLGFDAYQALLQQRFGPNFPPHIWSYPPHVLLFTWPFGFLPYMPAYILYCALGLILYVAVTSDGDRQLRHLLLLAIAPAVVVNIWHGNMGFITTALLVGGLVQLDRRPILAGVLFGLLTVKPQLGILLPLVLALTGRWRTFVAAGATVLALFAGTAAVFGPKLWLAYWHDAMPGQTATVFGVFEIYMYSMPTVYMNARVAGLPVPVSVAIQAVISAITVVAVVWTFWRRRDRDLSIALLLTTTLTVTPYAFNYDFLLFSWVTIKLLHRSDNDTWDYGLLLAIWVMPLITLFMAASDVGAPISSIPILGLGGRLIWRLRRQDRQSATVPSPAAVALS